jgi:hypothetical protein
MDEANKTECVVCHKELEENNVELRIEGIGSLCSWYADEYETHSGEPESTISHNLFTNVHS